MSLSDEIKELLLQGEEPEAVVRKGYNKKSVATIRSNLIRDGLLEKRPRTRDTGASEQIEQALALGLTREGVIDQGFEPESVDYVIRKLQREGKIDADGNFLESRLGGRETKSLHLFARGTPIEGIIDSVEPPTNLADLNDFNRGLKFGMSLIVVGVRLAQEMSAIGIAQARPLIGMAREMRIGEESAAKTVAMDVLQKVGGGVLSEVVPRLDSLEAKIAGARAPASGNPFADMMVRAMEPAVQGLISRMLPAAAGGPKQLPSGWEEVQQ